MRRVALGYLPVAAAAALALQPVTAHAQDITIVLSEEPDLLEPCQSSRSNIGRVVKQNIVETLTEIDPNDGSITPRLATEWSPSETSAR